MFTLVHQCLHKVIRHHVWGLLALWHIWQCWHSESPLHYLQRTLYFFYCYCLSNHCEDYGFFSVTQDHCEAVVHILTSSSTNCLTSCDTNIYLFISVASLTLYLYKAVQFPSIEMPHLMFYLACKLCSSETWALLICDMSLTTTPTGEEYLTLTVKTSKTDKQCCGAVLYTGHAKHVVCAVYAVKPKLAPPKDTTRLSAQWPSLSSLFGISSNLPMPNELCFS